MALRSQLYSFHVLFFFLFGLLNVKGQVSEFEGGASGLYRDVIGYEW